MLKTCSTTTAITNDVPELNAVCEYCASSNDDDGVAAALEMVLQSVYTATYSPAVL